MLRFRLTSLVVSLMISGVLVFLALTHKIYGAVSPIEPPGVIDVVQKVAPPKPTPPAPTPKPKTKTFVDALIIAPAQDVASTPDKITEPYQPAPPPQIIGATWIKRPGAREFDRYFPVRAMERSKEGRVVLNCSVNADGTINCAVASETPIGWGFGDAAVEISKYFKMAPQTVNGAATSGGTINVPIAFSLRG